MESKATISKAIATIEAMRIEALEVMQNEAQLDVHKNSTSEYTDENQSEKKTNDRQSNLTPNTAIK